MVVAGLSPKAKQRLKLSKNMSICKGEAILIKAFIKKYVNILKEKQRLELLQMKMSISKGKATLQLVRNMSISKGRATLRPMQERYQYLHCEPAHKLKFYFICYMYPQSMPACIHSQCQHVSTVNASNKKKGLTLFHTVKERLTPSQYK